MMLRRESFASAGSILLAFIASQHHTLHMLLFTLGLGGAGMSFMQHFPVIRRFMLAISLIMAGLTLFTLFRRRRPLPMRVMGVISAALTVALAIWSVLQYGI